MLRPWPPAGEWTWAASPARKTRPARKRSARAARGRKSEDQGVEPLPDERREGYDVGERARLMSDFPLAARAGAEIFADYHRHFEVEADAADEERRVLGHQHQVEQRLARRLREEDLDTEAAVGGELVQRGELEPRRAAPRPGDVAAAARVVVNRHHQRGDQPQPVQGPEPALTARR